MKRFFLLFLLSLIFSSCGANRKVSSSKLHSVPVFNSTADYIAFFKPIAIDEMNQYGIPASITLAQGVLESASGKGRLALEANNHFGIKCHDWKGKRIYHDDDRAQECFRKYDHPRSSYRDHSLFLANRKRYAGLFKLKKTNYKGWAKGLRKAGYATDPKYAKKLIALIERYELYRFDKKSKHRKSKSTSTTALTYTVKKGDTLYSLAQRYNTSVESIKLYNKLKTNDLYLGQSLLIPSN
jgi:flagellum-specific peptidoglycan hydrolase FlgJ